MSLIGCDRYEVENYYTGTATVQVHVDWKSRFGTRPSGMTIMLAKDGDAITYTDVTNDVDSLELQLEPGEYKMVVFNLSAGEFGSMRFFQMKSFDQAYAYAEQLQRTTDFWDVNVSYMREPDSIGCAVDTFTVLPEMIDDEFRFVPWRDKVEKHTDALVLKEVVEPMTTELFIHVKVIGYKYMASVIGNISGMADGFLLSQAWRRPQAGYHLLNNWTMKLAPKESDSETSVGYISTRINVFGLPHGRELLSQRESTSNMLSLVFTLIDERQVVFRYPVGKHIRYRTANKVRRREAGDSDYFSSHEVTLDLELLVEAPFYMNPEVPNLPYAQPTGTGAFDAEVADWGDDEVLDVPI